MEVLNRELSTLKQKTVKKEVLDQQISDIEDRLSIFEQTIHNSIPETNLAHNMFVDNVEVERELHRKYARKNRVVCIGVPRGLTDNEFVNELYNVLELSINETKIIKMFRIKAKNITSDKTKPLNIEFSHGNDKSILLSQTIRNRINALPDHSKFKNVKIFHDRTFRERESHRLLKLEMADRNKQLLDQGILTEKYIIKNFALIKTTISMGEGEEKV